GSHYCIVDVNSLVLSPPPRPCPRLQWSPRLAAQCCRQKPPRMSRARASGRVARGQVGKARRKVGIAESRESLLSKCKPINFVDSERQRKLVGFFLWQQSDD